MAESRLQRWSRKKTGALKEADPAPPSAVEPEPSPQEQELAVNETLPEQAVLAKYDLPDPDAIEIGTDITGFMRKEIPELLRRKALRSLWKSNPVLAVLDGLNDYDEDFSNAATTVNGVQTLYRVGQGMFDKTAGADKQVDEQAAEQIRGQAEASETAIPVEAEVAESELPPEGTEPQVAVESSANTLHAEAVVSHDEVEPAPRYRPRMRFT
ncbi:DUF3306 domain-containing protein [Marinobacter orientalis]|uniref:DUF3306 domain-containing protein n=1 Tax=Marinobacter orientalis TaxID=1928859 RepID=A0A7Y0WRN4_9GAMM|nr:DUF3306 domain-containing protein [Marinobacter orientalis]NMT63189.1 DUF3306 domain-containing protein [Marinobacter orientalis]TGX51843.1 DUF3306 domain-containing protein [Marinobacter orientalis]